MDRVFTRKSVLGLVGSHKTVSNLWLCQQAKITLSPFWSSITIARASLSVMTLKCSFFHSWLTMMPFFTRIATPSLVPTNLPLLYMS